MKSVFFPLFLSSPCFVNILFTLSLVSRFRCWLLILSSSMTRDVSAAVAAFLNPDSFDFLALEGFSVPSASAPPFFLFLDFFSGSFFSECVKPSWARVLILSCSRSISLGSVGLIGMTSDSLYSLLHYSQMSVPWALMEKGYLPLDSLDDFRRPPSLRSPRRHGRRGRCRRP